MIVKTRDIDSQFSDSFSYGSSSIVLRDLRCEHIRSTIQSVLPQVFLANFDQLRISNPLEHQALVDGATMLALVSRGHKPLACLPEEIVNLPSKVIEDLGINTLSVALPFDPDGVERLHIYNSSTIKYLNDTEAVFSEFDASSFDDIIREVMKRPQKYGADSHFHESLGMLYGYPIEAVRDFVISREDQSKLVSIRAILDKQFSNKVAKDTYSFIFNEQLPIEERRQCLQGCIADERIKSIALNRFDYESSRRNFGIGSFLWRDYKTSDVSQTKVVEMQQDLEKLGIPYYLVKGGDKELSFIRP
jgi:hypothetical protein